MMRAAMARTRRGREGFTLLELIIVIAVIGILAAIAIPQFKQTPIKAREAVLRTNLHTLRDALDQHYGDKGFYPPTLETLVEKGYLREIPLDPITKRNDTWEVVLEEVDPELAPAETEQSEEGQPGIIDVHSGSERNGLDGTPYAEW
jgi:prepilin-type N-terminal cleavage/methylation domain-containing protein